MTKLSANTILPIQNLNLGKQKFLQTRDRTQSRTEIPLVNKKGQPTAAKTFGKEMPKNIKCTSSVPSHQKKGKENAHGL